MKRINFVLILLVLAFLFANGCGGGNGTLINLSPGVPPVVIGAITTNQTPNWYAGTAGTISIASVTGGTSPYTYAWTFSGTANPAPLTSTAAAPSVTPAAVGTLHAALVVTDTTVPTAKTANASQDFTITAPPFPPLVIGTIVTSVVGTWNQAVAGTLSCPVSGGSGSGYTYAWAFSGTANPAPTSSTTATQSVTPAVAGTLHVTLHVVDATAVLAGDATPADFTIAAPPPPNDTLWISTDKDTYAVGETIQITANVQNNANPVGQFDAIRLVFSTPATGHYLLLPTGLGAITFKLGPNMVADPGGTNVGFFSAVTAAVPVPPQRTLSTLPIAFLTSEETIPALNNQALTGLPGGLPDGNYDLRDIAVIWAAGGVPPFPDVPATTVGAAFTLFEKVQAGASGQTIQFGFVQLEGLTPRTYYTYNADPVPGTKYQFTNVLSKSVTIS